MFSLKNLLRNNSPFTIFSLTMYTYVSAWGYLQLSVLTMGARRGCCISRCSGWTPYLEEKYALLTTETILHSP